MSTLENETAFRKTSEFHTPIEAQFNASTELILIKDHQSSCDNSLERLGTGSGTDGFLKNIFRKKTLYKRLPIMQWLPKYSREDAIGDMIAGITVGMTVIPQGLAYSGVAGLPTEYGLYGAFMGCFAYVIFGTIKDVTVGSTAVASLLVYQFAQGVWQRAVLLTFLTGIIELLMAIFKLGFLVEFVSGPVSAGFTSAVALIISTSQIRNMIGVKSEGASFLQRWISMISNIENIRVVDTILGLGCVAFLIAFRYIGRIKIGPKDDKDRTLRQRIINKVLWFSGISSNATVVLVTGSIAAYLHHQGKSYFRLTGYIPPGIPEPGLPPFSIDAVPGNATAGIEEVKDETFMEMVEHMGYGLIIVPMVAMLENISSCKAFAQGKPIDATQELIAIGMANIGNALFKGYRANGGLARSAVNNASGVRTPLGNFWIGLVVVLALVYLTEYFFYIPKAVLAAIIISAVIFQLQYHVVLPMWRSKRSDLIPCFVAFIACLVMPLQIGILIAIGVNLLFILYHSARPKITLESLETPEGQKFIKVTPDRCLVFPSVEFVRNLVFKAGSGSQLPVVLDCTYIYSADYTAAKVISEMISDFQKRFQKIIFFNLKPNIVHMFEGLNTKLIVCYNAHSLTQELRDIPSAVANGDVETGANATESVSASPAADSQSNASTITLTKL